MSKRKRYRVKKIRKLNEFRKHGNKSSQGHPAYVFVRKGKTYNCIGITHSGKTRGLRNIELEKNPDPMDDEKAYLHPRVKSDRISNFGPALKNWKFTDNDKIQAEKIINSKTTKKKKGR